MDPAVVSALITAGVTLFIGWRLNKGQKEVKAAAAQIEIKVDGRLEAALIKIDRLESTLSGVTGFPAPPMVSGQSGVPTQVIAVPTATPLVPPTLPPQVS